MAQTALAREIIRISAHFGVKFIGVDPSLDGLQSNIETYMTLPDVAALFIMFVTFDVLGWLLGDTPTDSDWGTAIWQANFVIYVLSVIAVGADYVLRFYVQHLLFRFAQIPEPTTEEQTGLVIFLRPLLQLSYLLLFYSMLAVTGFPTVVVDIYYNNFDETQPMGFILISISLATLVFILLNVKWYNQFTAYAAEITMYTTKRSNGKGISGDRGSSVL
jgi:hypothetical protein